MHPKEKEKLLQSIGNCIRRSRMQSDKAKKEIAALLKITTQAYGRMERGKCDICVSRLIELATVLNTPIYQLVPKEYQDLIFLDNLNVNYLRIVPNMQYDFCTTKNMEY